MHGLMMDSPLTISALLERNRMLHSNKMLVSRTEDGGSVSMTHGEFATRVFRLMSMLRVLGVRPSDRAGTLAWNHHRHLELYFGVPMFGAVVHTINVRLTDRQILGIVAHAQDRVLFIDRSLWPRLEPWLDELKSVEHIVLMSDRPYSVAEVVADPSARRRITFWDYETLLAQCDPREDIPALDERTAAGLCYTSGTTGEPKGALYSHRSVYLHTLSLCTRDSMGIHERDVVLPAIPMFHVNAWGIPHAAIFSGAKLVLSGDSFQAGPLIQLIDREEVTLTAGVPTIWNMIHTHVMRHGGSLRSLKAIFVGGGATPPSLQAAFARDLDLKIIPAWGMTETSPVGSINHLGPEWDQAPEDRLIPARSRHGRPVPGVNIRIRDDHDRNLPWDGVTVGELQVQGPWILSAYYNNPTASERAFTADGWFRTGDIASIASDGSIRITDRIKDLVKMGGEWISSVDMENLVMTHPHIQEAAVVAHPDPLRGEIPVLLFVTRPESATPPHDEILGLLNREFAPWQLPKPNHIQAVAELPKTSVGKIDKKLLRASLETRSAN